jgi:hypothetical protein
MQSSIPLSKLPPVTWGSKRAAKRATSASARGRRKARRPKAVTKVRSHPAAPAGQVRSFPLLWASAAAARRSPVDRYSSRWRLVTALAAALLSKPSTTDSTGRLSTLGFGSPSRSATVLAYSARVSRRRRRGPGTSSPLHAGMALELGGAISGGVVPPAPPGIIEGFPPPPPDPAWPGPSSGETRSLPTQATAETTATNINNRCVMGGR